MTALELYNAVFDSANNLVSEDEKTTIRYIQDYAENGLDVSVSTQTAQMIIDCYNDFTENGQGSNDFFYKVETKLQDIEL